MGPDDLDDLLASIRSEGDEGPAGLDELLEGIRSEGKKKRGGALALYQGTRETDLVDEYIDERILRILAIGQVFDIDYATYKTLLKEKLVQVSVGGGSLARDEQMLLQDEFRRIKSKVGRFKLNKKKASVNAVTGTTPLKVSKDKFFLTGNAVIPESPGVKKVSEDLKDISESLDKILAEIRADNKEEKRQAELERRQTIRKRRTDREKLLEKEQKKVSKVVSKVFSPVKGILNRIFDFLLNAFLGIGFSSLLNWFSDPKNKEKVDSIFRFLKDFWPLLTGGLLFFFTPFGGFVRGIFGVLKFFGPKMLGLIKANKVLAGALGLLGVGAAAANLKPEPEKPPEPKGYQVPDQKSTTESQTTVEGFTPSYFGGGIVDSVPNIIKNITNNNPVNIKNIITPEGTTNLNDITFQSGGPIRQTSGVKITGAGPDTQLIAAQPGEFVVSKRAVNAYGPQFFMNLNRIAGGTNIPKFSNGVQLAQGGGVVGGMMSPDVMMSAFRAPSIPRMSMSAPARSRPVASVTPKTKGTYHPHIMKPSGGRSFASASVSSSTPKVTYSNSMLAPSQIRKTAPEPPSARSKVNVTTLPEITNSSGGISQKASAATTPSFSAAQISDSRIVNFAVYGIEGMI